MIWEEFQDNQQDGLIDSMHQKMEAVIAALRESTKFQLNNENNNLLFLLRAFHGYEHNGAARNSGLQSGNDIALRSCLEIFCKVV